MSIGALTVTGVVEQMLGHAADGRWEALDELLDESFEIVERTRCPTAGHIAASAATPR